MRMTKRKDVQEHKATILGTSANLINAIVGAGIVGIPFAIRKAGLVAGVALVLFCAYLTEKSLRLLVVTAKFVNVTSYETLAESTFGRAGFLFVSANMFIMSYGAMISYLMIVKDTLPVVLGISLEDDYMRRTVLTITSLLIMLPLSCQRDMADLAKTSRASVLFDCAIVGIIAVFAPVKENIAKEGGFIEVVKMSTIRPNTIFVGLGVLSFAFVCQHSAFIIAGSLAMPTRKRWSQVTTLSLVVCAILATMCGTFGYLGFLESTDGNILNNFSSNNSDGSTARAANIARTLLCTTMFFVYPMESFVCRHVCVVTLFRGRDAHDGDDATVLARKDRRIILTVALYTIALIPALICKDLGNVLSVTGAIGGSCLSYIGPGCCYLAVHGEDFKRLMNNHWSRLRKPPANTEKASRTSVQKKVMGSQPDTHADSYSRAAGITFESRGYCCRLVTSFLWNISLMPVWFFVATTGAKGLIKHREDELQKSTRVSRIGRFNKRSGSHHQNGAAVPGSNIPIVQNGKTIVFGGSQAGGSHEGTTTLTTAANMIIPDVESSMMADETSKLIPAASTGSRPATITSFGNKSIGAAILAQNNLAAAQSKSGNPTYQMQETEACDEIPEETSCPTMVDFFVAIFYIIFGVIALVAGLVSIVVDK